MDGGGRRRPPSPPLLLDGGQPVCAGTGERSHTLGSQRPRGSLKPGRVVSLCVLKRSGSICVWGGDVPLQLTSARFSQLSHRLKMTLALTCARHGYQMFPDFHLHRKFKRSGLLA